MLPLLTLPTATPKSPSHHWPVYNNFLEDTTIAGVVGLGEACVAELAEWNSSCKYLGT